MFCTFYLYWNHFFSATKVLHALCAIGCVQGMFHTLPKQICTFLLRRMAQPMYNRFYKIMTQWIGAWYMLSRWATYTSCLKGTMLGGTLQSICIGNFNMTWVSHWWRPLLSSALSTVPDTGFALCHLQLVIPRSYIIFLCGCTKSTTDFFHHCNRS